LRILYFELFWMAIALIPMIYFVLTTFRRRSKDLDVLAGKWRGPRVQGLFFLKTAFREIFFFAGFLFLILALLGFYWGFEPVEEENQGLQIAMVLDISRSMQAEDLRPSRLELGAQFLKGLVETMEGQSFSLTLFRGAGVTVVPLTFDALIIDQYLDMASPSFTTAPGTNLADGLRKGWNSLQSGIPQFKVVVLVSDGDNFTGNPGPIIDEIRREEGHLLAINIGTTENVPIPLASGGFLLDQRGREVHVPARPDVLEALVEPGHFWDAAEVRSLPEVVSYLQDLGRPQQRGGVRYRAIPRFQIFLWLALFFFVLEILLRMWKWKKVF